MLEARSCAWLAGLWFVASLGHVHTQDSLSLSIMNVSVTTTSEPPPVKVCFTGITMDISGEILIYLNCGDSTSNEDSVEGTTVTKNNDDKSICSEHLMTLAIYKPNLNCIITVYNKDNPDLQEHGEVIFDMPAKENFPDCTFGGKWTDLNLLALLCQPVGDPNFNLLSEDGFTRVVDSTNIIYYTTTTTPIATSVSLCMDEEGSTVNNNPATLKLCSGSVTVSDFTATGSDPLVANLKYEPSTSNTGTLEVSGAKDCDTNTCDLLTKNNDYVATTAATPSTTLTNLITRTSPPSNTDYLVLQYSMDSSTGGFKQSQYGVHTDYDVKTTVIETDILEVYWTSADDTSYGMSYTDAGGSTVSATVLCAVADTYCFGYFVKVPADTYSVSVSSSNGKNVITVPSVAIPSPAPKNEGYQDVVATLTIDTFIITSVATPSTITVCFGKGDLPLTPLKENVHLTCSAGTPSEISSEATSVTAAADNSILCSTHNIPSGDNVLDPNLHCILSVNNENQVPLGSSEVILAMPGALFDCSSPFLMSEANIMGMQCSARGDISNVVIDVDTDSYLVLDVTDATAVSTSYILIGSSSKVPSIDKDVLICYQVNNGAATSEFVKVCSSAGLKIDATKDLGIDKATETYTSSGGVKLTATLSDSALDSYDILAIDSSAFMCAGNKDTACTLTGYDRKQELAYIVVSGAPPSVKYQQGSVQGYNMVGSWLSTSTIEVNWINPTKSSPFTIKKEPTGGTFDSATVDCEDTDIYCYGYFTELPAGSYTVTLTPDSGKESVIGEPISNTLAIKGLQVQEVRLDWSIDSVRANASVCFNEDVARDPEGRKEYRVVLVDAQGHWLRAQEASQKREGALCFSGAAVDTRKFNTVDKVTVLVTRVGEDGRTALAHGEAHLFFMTPETEGVGGRVGRVTLGNPGGYTFTVRREGDPAPVTTSTTGRFVHYFVPRTTGPEVERLVVETEGLDVKMTTVVPLTPHVVPGVPGMAIKYMTFPITKTVTGNYVTALVDVQCTEEVTDADSLSLVVILPGDDTLQYVDAVDVTGISKDWTEVPFDHMKDNAFVPGDVTVVVAGHNGDVPVAYGQAQVVLTDPGSKAWRVGKQTDGSHEAFRFTFGETENDDGAQLDYDSSCDCLTSPCYCLGTARVAQGPQPFCLKLKTTASTTGGIILQCDNQLTASDAVNEAKVTSAKMTHKTSETVDVAVGVNFDGQLELLFYETGDTTLIKPSQTCSGPGSLCTITDQPANSATGDYSILAVTIDGSGDVKESSLLAFEDYKTKFTQLTSDAMEVRFSAKTKTLYQVTVTPDSGTYDTTTIECGAEDNNICTVYFISMTAGNYEASVQLRHNGEMNQVATQVIMGTTETKGQKGSVAPVNRQNPRDPILTGNLTTLASETNLGSRLPQLTHNSANKVDARTPFSPSFNELPELTVKYMTFPITKTSSGVDVPTLVDVEGADGTNANSLTLAFIVADGASATRQYVDVTDLAASTEVTFAHMNDNALVPGAVTVVVAGHNGEVPVAYGQAQVTLTDPGSKAWRVGKQTDGSHEAFRLTFGKTENDDGAQLDYDSSCDCPNSPCYCLGTARVAQEPQPFCLKLKITASTTGEIIFQCDNQLTASDGVNEAKVTSAKMTHKTSETVDVAVGVNFDGQAELLFYETGDTTLIKPSQTCSGPGSLCTITDQPANSATGDYSILAVTIDGSGDVKESILLAFEDYKTKVTQLTSDAIEVRFSAKTKTLYQVSVTPDGGAYDTTTIECGAEDNNLCTVYFIAMTARNDYEATVQLRTSGELNQVATQFVMETREKISRNATLAFRAKGSERLLDLCVGDQLPSTSGDYILVLIAGLNNTVITKGPLSNENPCFYDVSVDVQPSQHVNIMVLTDEENTRVVMETDVFILDQTSADISVTQVGSKALKATWSNRYLFDLEYEVGLDGVGHTVACKAQQECIEYIHLNSSQGNTNVTIKENNDGTVQVVSVEVSPVTIPELTIASRSIQWDDRLRVCFDRLATADAYELGLEKDDTHLQTNVHAQVDTHATSETCIVSADTVDVGAYVDLWMVVTAFEASGTILASGESTWNTILLSSSRNVRAAIQNTTILASWYLLDDTSTIDNFQVILRSSDGDTVMLASNTQSAYTFTSQSYGTYTVCVKALKVVTTESTVDSEEVCSDIIVFSSNAGPTQNVHETEPKSTAKDSVLLTWQPPQGEENVSGYYVSWSNVNPSSKRSPRRRLPPQSLMRSHEELQQWVSGEGDADFVIVPATETSVEVKDLQEDAKYTFCVSSIVNDVMAQSPACSNTSLADFTPLSPPSLLNPSGGELQWTDNNTGDITYMVEWRSPSEDDHLEVSETSYHLQVAPGKWDVSVRALSADSCSDPNTTTVTIPGVPTSILQVGSKKMTVAWYEEPTPQDNNRYIVDIFQDTQPVDQCTLGCSGDASKGDCSCEFSLETIQPPVVLTVSVHMYSQESYDLNFTMMQISGMRPVATTIRSSSEVDVKWEAVENAKFYQLSLYENESLSVVRWAKQQALPLWVTLTEEDMMGNVFVVQACTDESHCGDATQMTILDQNTSGGSSVVGAVLGGVLGVTILACVIFFFVKRQQVKKKERKALNDQEMAPAEYIYDEWGARRLGQAPVATTLSNTS